MMPHNDPLVISVMIAKHLIEQILEDNGSSVNLPYWNCFEKMRIAHDWPKAMLSLLYNFTGKAVLVVGSIQLYPLH